MNSCIQPYLQRHLIKKQIRALKELDLETVDEELLTTQVRKLLGSGYVSRPLLVNAPKVYRVRANRNHKAFENVRELWWPDPKYVLARGRCNEVGQPVFYCADSENTAIIEMRPKVGDALTVLTIGLADPSKLPLVQTIGIHEFTAKSNPRYGGTPPARDARQQEFIRREGIAHTVPLLNAYLVDEFLREVTLGNEHEYKITCSLAKILMNEPELLTDAGIRVVGQHIHGIAYPSIRSDKLGANLALKTDAADELYKPASCVLYRVEEQKSENHYIVGTLLHSTSFGADGEIKWEVPKTAA